jgi:hypothetical protein
MLVLLDDSLQNALASGLRTALLHFLEDVAGAARVGRHFVVGSRQLLSGLAETSALSEVARAVFAEMEQSAPTRQGLIESVAWRVRVTLGGGLMIRQLTANRREIQVPLAQANRFSPWPSTVLLLENQMEGRWYLWLAGRYARRQLGGARVEMSVRGGGGSTLSQEVQAIVIRQNELCLCVVDSDVKYPGGARGSTAKKAMKEARAPHCYVHILGVREAENTLPIEILEEVAPGLNRSQEVGFYRKLWDADANGEITPFLDIKEGEKWCDFHHGVSQRRAVLQAAASMVGAAPHVCPQPPSCNRSTCNCPLLPGMSKGLMAAVEGHLKETSTVREYSPGSWLQREWDQLGEALVAWGLGDERRAAL